MSNFPSDFDDDVTLPRVDDDITEVGGDAINALRDAVFNIENEIGLGGSGNKTSIAARLGISIDNDGYVRASALTSLGLVALPITDSQVSATAAIKESKLALDYKTADLYNYIAQFNTHLNIALNYVDNIGFKLAPHLVGDTYRHVFTHIDISSSSADYFKNSHNINRNNTNLYTLFRDFNKDLIAHEKADSTSFGSTDPSDPSVGTVPPDNYAHVAAGLWINTNNFSFIPQTINDLQQFAEFIDNSNIFILGTRIQTLFQNGISRTARSSVLTNNVTGQEVIPFTPAKTYLLHGGSNTPVDSFEFGDDIIEFFPTAGQTANEVFDSQFYKVKIGDIVTVNYNSVQVSFVIREIKFVVNGGSRSYAVRIAGKNLKGLTSTTAKITHSLFNTNKYGVLAVAPVNPLQTGVYPSLIVANPRGAEALGIGFNPMRIDETHYKLYLQLYPTGNPAEGVVSLPGVDITGELGVKPGTYSLSSIILSLNTAFRKPGFNYRFIAYQYKGEIGVMLAESYGGASFSIIAGALNTDGYAYNQTNSNISFPNNVIDVFNDIDPLGFGPNGSSIASPAYRSTFLSADAAKLYTKIFVPLKRNNFYIDGGERERLNIEPAQDLDGYGDGYWPAQIVGVSVVGGIRTQVIYQVNRNLMSSGLKIGKTIVAQKEATGTVVNFGRFLIEDVEFNTCLCDGYTDYTTITVYDGVHSTGSPLSSTAPIGTNVRLYFSGDSVGFNTENAYDATTFGGFKRYFEIFVNKDGYTFSQERARFNATGSNEFTYDVVTLYSTPEMSYINIYAVSPKLRGYSAGNNAKKIQLFLNEYNSTTGLFNGNLAAEEGINVGPTIYGRKGEVTRFYDETNVDYIDFIFDANDSIPDFSSPLQMDIQLFDSLALDDEIMIVASCQVNDAIKKISYLKDQRPFGNISEKQLSNSAIDFIGSTARHLNQNGIVRGFALDSGSLNKLHFMGGLAVVNGRFIECNNFIHTARDTLVEVYSSTQYPVLWALCVDDKGDIRAIPLRDDLTGVRPIDRVVRLLDTVDSFEYNVESCSFQEIANNRKDLTIIATYIKTHNGPIINTVTDARKFIKNSSANPAIVWTSDSDMGNFATLPGLLTWLKYNSTFNNTVVLKGAFNFTNPVTFPRFNSPVRFIGDGAIITTTNINGFIVNGNISFENISFIHDYFDGTSNLADYFENEGMITAVVSAASTSATHNLFSNLTVKNCTFDFLSTSSVNRLPAINIAIEDASCENIIIDNNKFLTTVSGGFPNFPVTAGVDLSAVVVITGSTQTVIPDGNTVFPSEISNLRITNNVCSHAQMICVSAPFDEGTSKIISPLVVINGIISGNICGAINILTASALTNTSPEYVNNTSVVTGGKSDKYDMLIVEKNTCKFIYTGFQDGTAAKLITSKVIRAGALLTAGVSSGNLHIINNTVTWIHVGITIANSTLFNVPVLKIKDNTFYASKDIALQDYYNYYGHTIQDPVPNVAIIVDKAIN